MPPLESQTKSSRLDRIISYLSPSWSLNRTLKRQILSYATQYKSADITSLRADWRITAAMNTDQTPGSSELQILRVRSRDANRNHPVAVGASDTLAHNIVGSGLKPQSRIPYKLIGISEQRAADLQMQAEAAFEKWTPYASADNRMGFDELQFVALLKTVEDGEIIALPTWAKESWRPYGRCIELLESERLSTPTKTKGGDKSIKHGIKLGSRGEPQTYHIRKANSLTEYLPIPARDSAGRPKILHVFPTRRPGQMRGIPYFAPVLTYFQDLASYLEAEIVAARVAACLSVFISKDERFGMTGRESSSNSTVQELSPGLIARLNTGESINVVDPKRPGDSFAPFVESVLRLIGVGLGLPYELLVKDFSKTNYSSARAALLEGRRVFKTWRGWLAGKFCQPIWQLVIEEAYLRGEFDAPDFYKYLHEYTRAAWIGGGWGWVDPVKEVEASRKAIDYGLSTLAKEAAAQGDDWEENLDQLARERKAIASRKVTIYHSATGVEEVKDEQDPQDPV